MLRLFPEAILDALAEPLIGQPDGLRWAKVATDIEPIDVVRAGAGSVAWAGYFSAPGGFEMAGLGVGWRTSLAGGSDRLPRLSSELTALGEMPRAFVGFSFNSQGPRLPEWDGFAAAAGVIPLLGVVRSPDGSSHAYMVIAPGRRVTDALKVVSGLEEPPRPRSFEAADHVIESHPAPGTWRGHVDEAVSAIKAGSFRKVVLARGVTVTTDVPAGPFDVVASLRDEYAGSYVFGWQEADSVFVGASPELLVSRHGSDFATNPLAGTAQRGIEQDMDEALGHALVGSSKDRVEHELVVEDIARRLSPLAAEINVPAAPSLVKLNTIQHLSTWITGTLAEDYSALELAGLLHPTPAVGGLPREDALAFIDKIEAIDRGWYAGGLGWADWHGEGEIAVALRCGLLRGTVAHLYGGAGIVAASDPESELVETRLKLRPLLDILSAT
jgi:salicylate biosynthesis isochorismate synthase/menaquinone-specific isochorismate synthase